MNTMERSGCFRKGSGSGYTDLLNGKFLKQQNRRS